MKRLLILILALSVGTSSIATALDGQDVMRRVRRAYDRVNSFQADFDQTFIWKLAGSEQQMTGRFLMAKPNKFRVQTEVQTVVTDGRTVWSYSPATRQVILNDYDPATMPLRPDNFLLQFPDEDQVTYVGEQRLDGKKVHVLDVLPKDGTLGITSARVWVDADSWMARKVTYVSVNEDTTVYALRDVQLNASMPDTAFSFRTPDGVEVVDFRASTSR